MIKCSKECEPCCDFCVYASWSHPTETQDEPYDICIRHQDDEHENEVLCGGYCDDFRCIRATSANQIVVVFKDDDGYDEDDDEDDEEGEEWIE